MNAEKFILNYGKHSKQCSGVYQIEIDRHVYIGSCSSKRGMYVRWANHCGHIMRDRHHSFILQRCFNTYQTATFSILEVCERSQCLDREQYYMDLLKPDMNICKKAGTPNVFTGKTHTDEARKAIGEKHKKPIVQYDLEMNMIHEWPSSTDAARELGLNTKAIGMCLRGRGSTSGGYKWKYKD